MHKAVDDAVKRIDPVSDDIEVLRVARVVTAEDGICDMICNLYETRGPRIDKEGCVCNIFQLTPPCTDLPELTTEFREGPLAGRLVENKYAAL